MLVDYVRSKDQKRESSSDMNETVYICQCPTLNVLVVVKCLLVVWYESCRMEMSLKLEMDHVIRELNRAIVIRYLDCYVK